MKSFFFILLIFVENFKDILGFILKPRLFQKAIIISSKLKSQTPEGQIFGIATYDALFKYVLSEDTVRPSFFRAFIPNVTIKSSIRLDDHMNPTDDFQLLREFVHRNDTLKTVKRISSSSGVLLDVMESSSFVKDEAATIFFREMLAHFGDIRKSFPAAKYDGTMDFACALDNNEYALVEMQVVPHNYWDNRALAYAAAFYGNQLKKGGHWSQLRKVIGINILGGGKDDQTHWKDTPGQYIRHYKFQEQLHSQGSPQYIDGIELIQYSIMNAPEIDDIEKREWITFFKRGHRMNEEEVATDIKTPEVLQAFERARLSKLPREVRDQYIAEDLQFDRFSHHTDALISEAVSEAVSEAENIKEIETRAAIAGSMIRDGFPFEVIAKHTGLTQQELAFMKQQTASSGESSIL